MAADLISLLGQASNSLGVIRATTATAGHNVENANTPGYSRQRVEPETQGATYLGPGAYLGRGAMLGGITQSRDVFLERQIPAALSSQAQHSAESTALDSIGALNTDAGAGLGDAISGFYSSLRELAQNPGDRSLRTGVIGSAKQLASAFATVGNSIEAARTGIDTKFASNVDEVNSTAAKIATLNVDIAMARARGAEPNDLLDQRLKARDRLAVLTGASPVPDDKGNISMVLPNGIALVSGAKSVRLSTIADPANDGHLSLQITRIGASTPDGFVGLNNLGGEIRGLMDARDVGLKQTLTAIDTMAFDMGTAVNAQNRAGFGLDGAPGGDIFTLSVTAAGASRTIVVDAGLLANSSRIGAASSAATLPGDASNLNAVIATDRLPLSGGGDVSATLAAIIGSFGTAARSAKAMAEQDKGIADHLSALRESASGVSIDEEMISMTQAQRAFEAVTKMIGVTDSLLGTLLALPVGTP